MEDEVVTRAFARGHGVPTLRAVSKKRHLFAMTKDYLVCCFSRVQIDLPSRVGNDFLPTRSVQG